MGEQINIFNFLEFTTIFIVSIANDRPFCTIQYLNEVMGRRGGNRSVDGFASVRASINYHHLYVRSNPERDEVFSIQHYVIQFVSDLRQVGGFLHQ